MWEPATNRFPFFLYLSIFLHFYLYLSLGTYSFVSKQTLWNLKGCRLKRLVCICTMCGSETCTATLPESLTYLGFALILPLHFSLHRQTSEKFYMKFPTFPNRLLG